MQTSHIRIENEQPGSHLQDQSALPDLQASQQVQRGPVEHLGDNAEVREGEAAGGEAQSIVERGRAHRIAVPV